MKKIITGLMVLALSFTFLTNIANADYYSDKTTLYYGMYGSQVQELQQDLKDLGYFNFYKTTWYFGSITQQSVINYQRANGLLVDGIVGSQTSSEIKADMIIRMALHFRNAEVPYVWGGVSYTGFDCSGLTHYVFLQYGVVIPRTASAQYNVGTWVSKSNLKQGDLVFFSTYTSGASHVGIYIGNGQFVHASSGAGKVIVSDLSNTYYSQHYLGAKRVL